MTKHEISETRTKWQVHLTCTCGWFHDVGRDIDAAPAKNVVPYPADVIRAAILRHLCVIVGGVRIEVKEPCGELSPWQHGSHIDSLPVQPPLPVNMRPLVIVPGEPVMRVWDRWVGD
jgi:hypothetical protein